MTEPTITAGLARSSELTVRERNWLGDQGQAQIERKYDALAVALRDVPAAYESKVSAALDARLPGHAEGCDEGFTYGVCLRCDVLASVQVAFGFARPLAAAAPARSTGRK